MKALCEIFGKEFESKITGESYGLFSECTDDLPAGFSVEKFGTPIAEDGCGNIFTETQNGSVCFWDHETDDLTAIASSWKEFVDGCVQPTKVTVRPEDVKSVWVDPEFAKTMGIVVPKDGWIKRKG